MGKPITFQKVMTEDGTIYVRVTDLMEFLKASELDAVAKDLEPLTVWKSAQVTSDGQQD